VPKAVPLVRVVRSGVTESIHLGHVAVCDPSGRLLASAGDPDRLLFSRSSMKPLQAAVSLRRIGEPLPQDLVAIMCASHNGEPMHVRTVRRLLRSGGLSERHLGCPPDLPMAPHARREVTGPRRIYHNCSGKHAGMLLASDRSGLELQSYLRPSHPLQREIVRAVRTATGVDPLIGVDGCGAPVHGLPLRAMATLFARLSRPERLGRLSEPAATAAAAMRAEPYLVAGRGRSDTRIMEAVPGLICKVGAEGLHCAALLGWGIGVAVRIDDGSDRAAAPALVKALELLGLLDEDEAQLERLAPVAAPPVLGGGRPVGALEAGFRLGGRG
jgi:L-asparaginase II